MDTMPLTLAIILLHHWKPGWRILQISAATFILSQVGHIPFNALMTWLFSKTARVNLPVVLNPKKEFGDQIHFLSKS